MRYMTADRRQYQQRGRLCRKLRRMLRKLRHLELKLYIRPFAFALDTRCQPDTYFSSTGLSFLVCIDDLRLHCEGVEIVTHSFQALLLNPFCHVVNRLCGLICGSARAAVMRYARIVQPFSLVQIRSI